MNILLLSAYDAQSHQYWRTGLVDQFPDFHWQVLTLPARFFSWRIRGNSLTWAFSHRDILSKPYDLIIATSMCDISSLKGFVPALANVPTIVYFHENQFAYPQSGREHPSVEPQILSIYNALAADKVLFNSQFNYDSFIKGASELLKKLPDQVPKNLVEEISQKVKVLPVPLKPLSFEKIDLCLNNELQIVWNHRWEYDKGPELLELTLSQLIEKNVSFKMHIVGQAFRRVPDIFNSIKASYNDYLGYWGYIEDTHLYFSLLSQSDIVLSTAKHDFQGLSVLQGMQCNAMPLVPNRLAYPEFITKEYQYSAVDEEGNTMSEHLQAQEIVHRIIDIRNRASKNIPTQKAPSALIKPLLWQQLAPSYLDIIYSVAK